MVIVSWFHPFSIESNKKRISKMKIFFAFWINTFLIFLLTTLLVKIFRNGLAAFLNPNTKRFIRSDIATNDFVPLVNYLILYEINKKVYHYTFLFCIVDNRMHITRLPANHDQFSIYIFSYLIIMLFVCLVFFFLVSTVRLTLS